MASPASITAPPRRENLLLINEMAIAWAMALAKLVFHIYTNNHYGYFVDEFDYMSCGDHLQWGYVDQPPLIPFLTHISRAVLGDSLRAIRFIPALATSLLIVQTAALTREFGGPPLCASPGAVSIAIAGMYLSNGNLLGTNCLEPNIWMGCVYCLILAIKKDDPRYWLGFGVIAGIGLEEKYSILVFVVGIVIGLLLTTQRRAFLTKWMWFRWSCGLSDLPAQSAVEHPLSTGPLLATDARHSRRRPRRGLRASSLFRAAGDDPGNR